MSTNPQGSTCDAALGDDAEILHAEQTETADAQAGGEVLEVVINQNTYGIRLTDTHEGRNSASLLINKMYAWRGYAGTHRLSDDPNRITLTATEKGGLDAVGTLTLGIDSQVGLLADEVFKEELDGYRDQGYKLCEMTKLAFDPRVQSKGALASLFHLGVIYARDLHKCSHIFIEANPRHRRFYEHMLGFKRLGEAKDNPRVKAPAYLLCVSLDYVTEQIAKFGGTWEDAGNERSFYPHFFSVKEERGIIERLMVIH
jgi:hypothetical protein